MNMIITSECINCIHATINDSNKAKIIVHCNEKEKDYIWGQCIPCDSKNNKKGVDN